MSNTHPERQAQIVELYGAGMSMAAIARQMGISTPTIRKYIHRAGFEKLPTGRPRWRDFTSEQVAEMGSMWIGGSSQTAIAKRFNTTQDIVSKLLIRHDFTLEKRRGNHLYRDRSAWWKGGRIQIQGYTAVLLDRGSPFMGMANGSNYVFEHRLVMAKLLGRPLAKHETVHHINGIKTDNRPENLQLRQGKHGAGEVLRCLDCGSHNIEHVPLAVQPTMQLPLLN